MAIRPGLLSRLERRLEEQEIAEGIALHRRTFERYGLPFTAQDAADSRAFWLYWRARPAGLNIEAEIQLAAAWWGDRLGMLAEEIIGEAERIVEEHDVAGECAADCPVCDP